MNSLQILLVFIGFILIFGGLLLNGISCLLFAIVGAMFIIKGTKHD